MRVISGIYKGRKLEPPANNKIRPTTDRIKETIFNILQPKFFGGVECVLDLFCGSGALGIEAISRGVREVIFNDFSADSVKLTNHNLKKIESTLFKNGEKLPYSYSVYGSDFLTAIRKLNGKKFDIIFIDPPYDAILPEKIISGILENDLLDKKGIIVFEHSINIFLINFEESFIIDRRKCGQTALSFLTLK